MGACVHTGDMHEDSVHLGDTLCLEGHCTPGDSMCLEGEQVPERTARAQRDSMFDKGQHLSIRTGVAWRDRMSLEGHMDFRESMCRRRDSRRLWDSMYWGVQQPLDMQCHTTIPGGPAAIRKIPAQPKHMEDRNLLPD